jgi:hypothetical protein
MSRAAALRAAFLVACLALAAATCSCPATPPELHAERGRP